MAETKKFGGDILFKVGSTPVAGETNCSLSVTAEALDAASKDSPSWEEFVAGRGRWQVSGDAVAMIDEVAGTLTTTQQAFFDAVQNRTPLAVEIASGALAFSGSVIITQFEIQAQDGQPAVVNWQGQGTGALAQNGA